MLDYAFLAFDLLYVVLSRGRQWFVRQKQLLRAQLLEWLSIRV